jgi:hypothetical protein
MFGVKHEAGYVDEEGIHRMPRHQWKIDGAPPPTL